MNFKMLYVVFFLLLGGFFLASSSGGRASVANEGNTGAPGDNAPAGRVCATCHSGAGIQVALDIDVADLDGNAVTSYVPGQVYRVKVMVNTVAGNPLAYGFQLVAEANETKQSTNSFQNPSTNAKLASLINGRQYAEHKNPSNTNEFTVEWTAPAAGTGDVIFYSAGNGVNLNGSITGDGASQTSFTLTEEAGSSAFEAPSFSSFQIAPNPAYDLIQVSGTDGFNGAYRVRVVDLQGRVVRQEMRFAFGGALTEPVMIGDLPAGTYFLQLLGEGKISSAQFYKR
jgi:hypothetical protein